MFTVTYNGCGRETFNTAEEVESYISEVLEKYKHLEPREVYKGYAADNYGRHKNKKIRCVIIWQYAQTQYSEIFIIEGDWGIYDK